MPEKNPQLPEAVEVEQKTEALLEELLERKVGALSRREYDQEDALIERLDIASLERRQVHLRATRQAAIAATSPEDWVLFRDKDGNEHAMLKSSGAQIIRQYYGIDVDNIRPKDANGIFSPERIDGDDGSYSYRVWCDARSKLTGQSESDIECERASSEDFIGRAAVRGTPEIIKDSDLRKSVRTLCLTKAVRVLAAMLRVPIPILEASWAGQKNKELTRCARGSGYGSGKERAVSKVATEEVKATAKAIWEAILGLVGGDVDDAKQVLKDITANPDRKFAGFDSYQRLAQDWQVKKAWENLKAHPMYQESPEE